MGNCSINCQNATNTSQNQLVNHTPDALRESNGNFNVQKSSTQVMEEKKKLEKDQQKKKQKRGSKKKKNLVNVEEQIFQLYENVNKLNKTILPQEIPLIIKSFDKHFLFSQLNFESKMSISAKMCLCTLDSENFVFKQGDKASAYFIIRQGECELIIDGERKKFLKQGDSFGDLALLFGAKRSASIRCLTKCEFWTIDRSSFRKAVAEINLKNQKQNLEKLKVIPFFELLTEEQKQAVLNAVVTLTYQEGDQIIRKGDQANSYYIIKSGTAFIKRDDGTELILNSGETFGEKSLTEKMLRTATVIAKTKCQMISIGKQILTHVLGDAVTVVINQNQLKIAFERSKHFAKLSKQEYDKLISQAIFKEVKKGEVIIKIGNKLEKIYILFQIKVSNNTARIIQQQNFFKGLKVSQDIIAQEDGYIAEIKYQVKQSKLNNQDLQQSIISLKQVKENILDINSLKTTNLFMIKKLGFGQFGQAFSVYSNQYRKTFAIKVINKSIIEKNNLSKHLRYQEAVLRVVDNPFIMKYYKTMKDSFNIYFLLEFIDGKQLFEVIRDIGILNSTQARFYTAQIILALEYLHQNNIIYRDLKPDNIMVGHDGYIKIIDMGTSKILNKSSRFRTQTVIGTPHYMAPETVCGKGYTFSSDLWSLGVCLFEFVSGRLPFCQQSEDPYEIYQEIIQKKVTFPIFLKDAKLKRFIEKLLSKVPQARLGCHYESLKKQDFFTDFNWDDIKNKKYLSDYTFKNDENNVSYQKQNKKTIKDYYKTEKKFDNSNKYVQKTYSWESLLNI